MNTSNRRGKTLSSALLVLALLASSLLIVQAKMPLPEKDASKAGLSAPTNLAPNAPLSPTRVSPADGIETTGNPNDPLIASRELYKTMGVPCFEWQSVPDATKYRLQVSEVEQDTAIVLDKNDLEQTMYCPTTYDMVGHGIQDEHDYYWRVRAYGGVPAVWGEWSTTWWSFTRHWAQAPDLLNPSANTILVQPPVLSWTSIAGAEFYELEVSSDPDFPDVVSTDWPAFTWRLTTDNTDYSLVTASQTGKNYLPNDADIYWRVRPVSAGKVADDYRSGPWSNDGEGRVFEYCWACDMTGELAIEYRPMPLTPVNQSNNVHSAYFSWTPVEGASKYDLEVNDTASFDQDLSNIRGLIKVANPGLLWEINKNWKYDASLSRLYWRVRAVNYYGVESEWNNEPPNNKSAAFTPDHAVMPRFTAVLPDLLYPFFYYEPVHANDLWEDRTVAVPTFIWDRVPEAISYTLQVDDSNLFLSVDWTITTGNLSATPTSTLPLDQAGVYYWRVSPDTNTAWSQRWKTRIDQSHQVLTSTAAPPSLIHPTYRVEGDGRTYGQQVLEYFPRLDWFPVSDADHYEVQIATDANFTLPLVETVETELTSLTPITRYPPDTYFWRVRAKDSEGTPLGTGEGWSSIYHFALARQFSLKQIYQNGLEWTSVLTEVNRLTQDPSGDHSSSDQFDLTNLYTAMDEYYWYLGWDIISATNDPPARFQLYLDVEGADGEGLNTNPNGGGTLPNDHEPYRPEHVLEWNLASPDDGVIYSRDGSSWNSELLSSSGYVTHTNATGRVMFAVLKDTFGSPATLNALLVSINDQTGSVADTMDLGYVTVSVSPIPRPLPNDRYTEDGRPFYVRTPLMTWHTLTNIRNVIFESATSFSFSLDSRVDQGGAPSAHSPQLHFPFAGSNPYYMPHDAYGDNPIYYWRVRSRHPLAPFDDDAWEDYPNYDEETSYSRPTSFTKQAQVPTNLTISDSTISGTLPFVSQTPIFSWDPVQNASAYYFTLVGGGYDLTVEGSVSNKYVPPDAIPNGFYEWHIHVIDSNKTFSVDNYASAQFQKGSDTPTPVFPIGSDTFTDTVYFIWEPLEGAAYYKLEIASDPYWNINYKAYDKINNIVFVPEIIPPAVTQGNFYWRVCGYSGLSAAVNLKFMGCESYYLEAYSEQVYLPLIMK